MRRSSLSQAEIVSALSRLTDPTAVVYSITMQQILNQIALRMGEDALSLTQTDLQILQDDILSAIDEMIDCRDAIDEGIEVFKVTRQL